MDNSAKTSRIKGFLERLRDLILPSERNNFQSRFIQNNALLYCIVFLLVLKILSVSLYANFSQDFFLADITKSALETFTNQARQSAGLQPLAENQKLEQAAQLKAENMVQNQYFSHTSPTGVTPWYWFSVVGYNYKYAGENLAVGFFDSKDVYDAWLNSPSHKANILNPNYKDVGTAVVAGFGSNNTIVVVQEFGSQAPLKVTITKNTAKPVTIQPKIADVNTETKETTPETSPQVLSQTTKSQNKIEILKDIAQSNLFTKTIAFTVNNFDAMLQNVVYGASLLISGILIFIFLVNFKINFKKELVFRSALLIVLLTAALMLNKETIAQIIPHKITI